ncbi:hypothetical protein BWI15_22145 [Kribbella sp. ALI-6-A]|uniref:hypothetical protein n=1 Tax=Kribbella sp. ALI-6-A TaxID=1933817 RepID=UPI00097BD332|nr:hypothetical protein [Kribbella sp. ALI-6-A]ONI69304.1 hypothetical protein BWI15_22145 [Kribbella sp. ALI-6-A]
MLETVTAQFIRSATQLPPDTLARVVDEALARWRHGGREASKATKILSAPEYSAIDHAVRSALLPRAEELDTFRKQLHSDAIGTTQIAARAVLKRTRIAEEHLRVLVEPFTAAGVATPPRDV